MKRTTFMSFPHVSDCCELNEVVVERCWSGMFVEDERRFVYRLRSYPATCKCGHPIHFAEPSQRELAEAYHLQEAEDV